MDWRGIPHYARGRRLRRGDCSGALLYRCLGFDPGDRVTANRCDRAGRINPCPSDRRILLCVADRGSDGDLFPSDTELVRDLGKLQPFIPNDCEIRGSYLLGPRLRGDERKIASYSAAIRTSGAAALISGVTCCSNLAKFFWNMLTRSRAVRSNSALSFQVLNGLSRCGSTPGTEVGTEKPK